MDKFQELKSDFSRYENDYGLHYNQIKWLIEQFEEQQKINIVIKEYNQMYLKEIRSLKEELKQVKDKAHSNE